MDESVFNSLNSLLKNTDLRDVTNESAGFSELPEGYYLCEVEKAELTQSKKSGEPMVAIQFKVAEDGCNISDISDDGSVNIIKHKGTKNRKIFMYYVLKDEAAVKRFVTDMLKFEISEGESILPKEAFSTADTLEDALDVLIGMTIFVRITVSEKDDGTLSRWNNLISWKRAKDLGLE